MSDLTTTRIFTDGERGITAAKLNDIVGSSTIQPAFYSSKPTAPTADPADIALILKAGAYAQVPISALAGSATQAQIWATRLRSYNSVGNCTFEVDQRVTGGSGIVNPGLNVFVIDRWMNSKNISGALSYSAGQSNAPTAPVILPGTNFRLSNSCLFISLNTQQTTLAAGEVALLNQQVESPMLRELISDVHSLSVLAYTNVSGGLKFSLSLRDPAAAHSLVKLCTVTTSGVWQLIQMPNIPLWNAAGNWGTTPGTVGYQLGICFAAGANFLTAPDVWANGNFVGATGMDNLGSKPVGSYVLIGFVQHEPGPLCTTLMDKPFSQNYNECLRYYCKSYDYDVKPGIITYAGVCSAIAYSTGFVRGGTRYPVPMAKTPTVTTWTPNNATAGAALDDSTGLLVGCSPSDVGKAGLGSLNNGSAGFIAGHEYSFHYTADTGW